MQAAIGCAQLEKLPAFIVARKKNWRLLREGLADLNDCFILPEATKNSDPSWFGFLLTVRERAGFSREKIVQHLESKGIQTRIRITSYNVCYTKLLRIVQQVQPDEIYNLAALV